MKSQDHRSRFVSINSLITAKKPYRLGIDYYKRVKNLILSGYSHERARYAAMHPESFFV